VKNVFDVHTSEAGKRLEGGTTPPLSRKCRETTGGFICISFGDFHIFCFVIQWSQELGAEATTVTGLLEEDNEEVSKQCCGSGSTGPTFFCASWIRIRIH
jgi:hypothetical protein